MAVLCAVFGAVLAFGQAVVIRHEAQAAADLAALAAADHWMRGAEGACATAERVAKAQGSRLVRCEVEGEISDVTAASGTGPLTAESRARAGPPGPSSGWETHRRAPWERASRVRGAERPAPHDGARQTPRLPSPEALRIPGCQGSPAPRRADP
ncbi:flp pilus-assembly TadE/G-like family protein [Streptomyces sp. DSM 3412]|uniref:Flp pilus-assembly TadE/G-like family protein n=1 Tax=Streptomyces gottesmaniae TaxID=3075518 RepID=A0ABU2Z0D3_9ACTN|nr:Rv3654c family TadE-like protein [Streptomyces sp. DSM 3412]MDT0568907.1 flp pilus-assembly TadE/G-like family protein [Streptomyces sp. DSM 3412]